MSNTIHNNSEIDLNNQQLNTFYVPSFGDEEFNISSINQQNSHIQTNQLQSRLHSNMDQHQYQMPRNAGVHNMGILDDQNQYNLWNPDSQQIYLNQNDFDIQATNQVYYSDPLSSPHQHPPPHQQQHQDHNVQQMMMMPPPQKSPQVTSPMNFIGQSPHGYGENGTTSDDSDDSNLRGNSLKRPSPEPINDKMGSPNSAKAMKPSTAIKKPKVQRKKKKKDPNEPQKPVSAYALFFRDTQAAIKGQNPNASFGEVSTIVASMWDVLAPEHKDVYKKKTEAAKIEYLKTLAAYRASVVSKGSDVDLPQQPPQQLSSQQQPPQQAPHSQPSQQQSPHHQQMSSIHTQPHVSPQHHPIGQIQPPMQQPNHQTPYMQQQQPIHNSYPQYVNAYKSPPQQQHSQNLDYGNQMAMQPNMHTQQQMQQPVSQPIQQPMQHPQMNMNHMNHSNPNQMNYGYDQSHATNSMIPADTNASMYHQPHLPQQQQQQQQHHQQQSIPAQHNQNTNHINSPNGTGGVGGGDIPASGMNTTPLNVYNNQQHVQQCIRNGCTNQAIVSPDWEDEYCSNECVITHCGDVFGNWIHNNQQQQSSSAVK